MVQAVVRLDVAVGHSLVQLPLDGAHRAMEENAILDLLDSGSDRALNWGLSAGAGATLSRTMALLLFVLHFTETLSGDEHMI